jgi:Glycosyltransferases involved in cell wall biogenesis
MISILIPVFNQDITRLARDVSAQINDGELIIMDDGSAPRWTAINKTIAQLPRVRYIENGVNQGRVKIRQLLAQEARYDWLLFIDGDSAIISENFLLQYRLPPAPSVIVGGRIYAKTAPEDCLLHWKYGSAREKPGSAAFMSNNFLVHKSIFNQLVFTHHLDGYGHEDTWIGIQLEKMQVPVEYINNPVLHDGLETTPVFLAKSEKALHNLNRLQQLVPVDVLKKHVKLYRVYHRLRSLHLLWLPGLLQKQIIKNLHSSNPNLWCFDVYRLVLFINIVNPR